MIKGGDSLHERGGEKVLCMLFEGRKGAMHLYEEDLFDGREITAGSKDQCAPSS